MTKYHTHKKIASVLLLFLSVVLLSWAQAPATDLDSITEDSYRRMQQRQEAERKRDTLISPPSKSFLGNLIERQRTFFFLGSFLIVVPLGIWYYRRTVKKMKL